MLKKYDIIELLINCGADIDAQNISGKTSLMLSAQSGDEQLIDFLLDYGADKNIRDKSNNSAMEYALRSRNPKCAELIEEDRPVKPNPARLARAKHTSIKGDTSSVEQLSSSDAPKKFENIFGNNANNSNLNKSNASQSSPNKKHVAGGGESANTSRITEDNKLDVTKSNKSEKIDSWLSSDEDEDDDDEDAENESPRSKSNKKKENESFEAIFANASFQNKSITTNKSILKSNYEAGKKIQSAILLFFYQFFILTHS